MNTATVWLALQQACCQHVSIIDMMPTDTLSVCVCMMSDTNRQVARSVQGSEDRVRHIPAQHCQRSTDDLQSKQSIGQKII